MYMRTDLKAVLVVSPDQAWTAREKENYREEKLGVGGEERHLLHGQE